MQCRADRYPGLFARVLRRPIAALFLTALIVGCGGGPEAPSDPGTLPPTTPPDAPPRVATLMVVASPGTAMPVIIGKQVLIAAQPYDKDGQLLRTYPVTWGSSDSTIATVWGSELNGFVATLDTGSVTITAYVDGKQAHLNIGIIPIPVSYVWLEQSDWTLYSGNQVPLAAHAVDLVGYGIPDQRFEWSTSDAQVAAVDSDGVVTGGMAGTAIIAATAGGKADSLSITVVAAPVADWSEVTEDWLNYQGNARHTGYVPATLDPGTFAESWSSTPVPGVALNPVTAADGLVFVSSENFGTEFVAVLDATTGAKKWLHDFGPIDFVDPPTYSDGSVYVSTGSGEDSYIWGFSVADGSERFSTRYVNRGVRYRAPVVSGDTLYMAGGHDVTSGPVEYGGGIYAYSTDDGAELWYLDLNDQLLSTPVLHEGLLYMNGGGDDPKLTVADASTGTVVYATPDLRFITDVNPPPAPVLGDANDVINIRLGISSFDLAQRQFKWALDGLYVSQPSVANGVIYVRRDTVIVALRESDGTELWTWGAPYGVVSGPVIVTKNLLFATTPIATYAVDIATHRAMWSYPAGGHMTISKSGSLLIAQESGTITAIKLW